MSSSPPNLLGTPESAKEYRRTISNFVRQERFSDAEAVLLADLQRVPSELSGICQSLSIDNIVVTGWEQLNGLLARPRLDSGKTCTALQIDMSNHVNSSDGSPAIEV